MVVELATTLVLPEIKPLLGDWLGFRRTVGSDTSYACWTQGFPQNEAKILVPTLNHVRGCTSFMDVRTHNSVTLSTFRGWTLECLLGIPASATEACASRGLLADDKEWDLCLEEASVFSNARQMPRMFLSIDCNVIVY